jgi:hypothetical protein
MTLKIAIVALLMALVSPAFAQEPTPIDIAILTCVGTGFIPDGDPFEVLESLPGKNCVRACKAAARGCKAVVRAVDKCGVGFLKSSERVGVEICRGWGYTTQECRVIRDEFKADINWWKVQGKIERAACDSDMQTFCLSRCQSAPAAGATYTPPTQDNEAQLGGSYTKWGQDYTPPTQDNGAQLGAIDTLWGQDYR